MRLRATVCGLAAGAAIALGLSALATAGAQAAIGTTGASGVTGTTGTSGTTGTTGTTAPVIPWVTLHRNGHGPNVLLLQQELTRLHYVVGRRGVYDARTQRAVMAFRKMADMPRNEIANHAVFAALAQGRGVFHVMFPHQGPHAEGDLTHQVLALVGAHGRVERLYPMSSGRPGLQTQTGTFNVYMQEYGTNNDGMVNSSFFNGGDAIHGYHFVPPYPWSHGCLRVPIPDSLSIRNWLHIGTIVDVYYRPAPRKHHR
jgi:peptidoglycan hydrolase-like protein with peptidoglycan-binding domain